MCIDDRTLAATTKTKTKRTRISESIESKKRNRKINDVHKRNYWMCISEWVGFLVGAAAAAAMTIHNLMAQKIWMHAKRRWKYQNTIRHIGGTVQALL